MFLWYGIVYEYVIVMNDGSQAVYVWWYCGDEVFIALHL